LSFNSTYIEVESHVIFAQWSA